jgi:hypothetical protein
LTAFQNRKRLFSPELIVSATFITFTEQGLRYITDSRNKRPDQKFVLNHLDKISTILKTPLIIGRSLEKPDNYLYFKEIAIRERRYQKLLFVVILKKSNIHDLKRTPVRQSMRRGYTIPAFARA